MSTPGQARPDFPVLDSLRAVGALTVLTTHVAFQSGDYVRYGALGPLLARLDIGVALFFVLSGFLLSRPWIASAALGAAPPRTLTYLRKRAWRIYPLYAVTVVLALLVVRGNDPGNVWEWVRALTMSDIYTPYELPLGLSQMWSLAVEVSFYLLLPLLMRVVVPPRRALSVRRATVLLGSMVVLSCVWNLVLAGLVDALVDTAPLLWLPAHLSWFVVGIALAMAHVRLDQGSASPSLARVVVLGRMPGVCWALAVGFLLVVSTPLGGPILLQVATPTQSLLKHLGYAVIAGLIVLTGIVASPSSRYARLMSHPGLRHLGLISYGIFCVHLVALDQARLLLGHELFTGEGVQLWLITVALSLVAAEVLYRVVELPGMRLGGTGRRGADLAVAHVRTTTTVTTTR